VTTAIPLRIYSDFLCPYCFLAEKQLDRLRNDYELHITWIGFELHPEIPAAGMKAGMIGASSLSNLWERVAKTAAEYEIDIRPPSIMPNTHLALEAAWELGQNSPPPVAETFRRRVFDALFLEDRDIGSQSVLLELANGAGADVNRLRQVLDERTHFDTVEDNREAGYDELVTGVPTILIGGLRALGVQPAGVYRELFDRAAGRLAG
jgi:predicted DsbA family dithiol-disulfide isomerase